ncbi:MAG: DsbA family protein, partial [Bifidobacteriaceae bacterium]|nr:DsbA family protein [Bifidobacteriaceae bacterium]
MNINNSKNNSSNNNEADSQTEFVNEFAVELDFLGKSLAGRSKKQYTLFMDFLCPYCGKFHQQYGQILKKRLAEGYINLKIIPLAWIDFYSNGHHYSIRAARAAEIVFR